MGAEMKRLKQLRQHEHNDFEAAQAEADRQRASAKAAAAKASALASAGAASAAAKKRALPKMLQIKRKDAGAEDEAASVKRPCTEAAQSSPLPAESPKEVSSTAGSGLLSGYGSGSSEEEDDDDAT